MFGLDDWIAGLSDGTSVAFVVIAAILLGLRHATDPDYLAAMSTLIAGTRERAARGAGLDSYGAPRRGDDQVAREHWRGLRGPLQCFVGR